MPQRGIEENGPGCWPIPGCPIGPRRRVVAAMLRGGRHPKFLRCPAGAWPVRRANRGRRPLARACPRLISCGVPPGRTARRWRQLFGGRLAARAAVKSSRHTRILQGCSTEKTKDSPADIGSLIGDFWDRRRPSFFSVLQLFGILARREDFPVVPAAISPPRRIAVAASLLVPEGRRRKLAGGKPASAGAASGYRVKRDLPQRGIGAAFWAVRRRGQVGPTAMVRHPGPFLRCPAGARSHSSPLPGAASAADWPPANFLRRPSGTGTGRPRPDHGKAPAREWPSQVVRLRLRRAVFIVSL